MFGIIPQIKWLVVILAIFPEYMPLSSSRIGVDEQQVEV